MPAFYLLFVLALLVCPSLLPAQDSSTTVVRTGEVWLPAATPARTDTPDIPAPPRALNELPPKGSPPPIPSGPHSWDTAPGDPYWPGGNQAQPTATVQQYRNTPVRPTGAQWAIVGEPTTSRLNDTTEMLHTGNWYAARSTDSGNTWSYLNPYTAFGAIDGGFCCDQATIAHQGAHITIWLAQFGFSATTNRGSIAVGVGVDAAGLTHFYRMNPEMFGFPAGTWFDYPHLGVSNANVFVSSNVYQGGSNAYVGSVVLRMSASSLRGGGAINVLSARSDANTAAGSQFFSARFALGNAGTTPTMFWASHVNTSTLRIFSWPDSSALGVSVRDRAVGVWYQGTSPAPGPDGRDWTARLGNRISGGAIGAQGSLIWCWASNAGGSFPRVFTRMVRFLDDFSLYSERNFWNATIAFAYMALAPNAAGHIGGTVAVGGGTWYPQAMAILLDDLDGFGGVDNTVFTSGNSGPGNGFWGDYLWAQYIGGNKWIATGQTMFGGIGNAACAHVNVEFGRQNLTTPVLRTLTIASSPWEEEATFTASTWDYGMLQGGKTWAQRSYRDGSAVTITAAATMGNRSFYRWKIGSTEQPVGQRALALTMTANQSITAVYGTFTTGTFTTYGAGCPGTNNYVPTHTGQGTPEIGQRMSWVVNHDGVGGANSPCAINLGIRQAAVPLAFLGMGTCTLDVQIFSTITFGLDGRAQGAIGFTLPNDMGLVGARIATQAAIFDLGAPTSTKVVQTAGLETLVGGFVQ